MNSIKYRPYGAYCYFAPVILIIGITFLAYGVFQKDIKDIISFAIMSIMLILYSKHLFDASNITVCFELEGITIIEDKLIHHHIPWEHILYGYDCRDYKRNLYLLLSQEELDNKYQKKIINKCMLLSSVYIDKIIVIFISELKETTEEMILIKEIISEKVSNL